ncbi:MAG: hypothetical protein QF915_05945 [Candidatus Woesearchaeota archaeon]|jgi:hypothetical protein|nr:hypothetical protein [Candidatus Woesearchaeota archaeon]MDP7457897.1 hypothetical protein [Candidatus Woesearchaeota archaeon]
MNKVLIIIGLILGIGGIVFSLLPPNAHMSMFGGDHEMQGMGENQAGEEGKEMNQGHHNHGIFVTYGLIAAVIGLGLAFAGWRIVE